MSIIQLIHAAVLSLNRIQSRSVSMIHAFRFASISKQLIYRDIDFFSNRISKISNQISNGITSSEQLSNFAIAAVIVIVCCAYSLYPGICSVLFSLGITSFSANHRLGLASINSAPGARIVRSQSVSQLVV